MKLINEGTLKLNYSGKKISEFPARWNPQIDFSWLLSKVNKCIFPWSPISTYLHPLIFGLLSFTTSFIGTRAISPRPISNKRKHAFFLN